MMTNIFESLSGAGHRRPPLFGRPSLVLELWSTKEGLENLIRIPHQYVKYVKPQFQRHGIQLERIEDRPRRQWTSVTELSLTNSGQPLRIPDGSDVTGRILSSVQAMQNEETVCMQWTVTPRAARQPPQRQRTQTNHIGAQVLWSGTEASNDEVNGLRKKATEANFMATLRIAAYANTKKGAQDLIHNVRHGIKSFLGPHQHLERKTRNPKELQRRMEEGITAFWPGFQLMASELAAIAGIPIGSPFIAGLAPTMARHRPAPASVPSDPKIARIIGQSNFDGDERDVGLAYVHTDRHMHLLGKTGSGKTTLMVNMMVQDMEQGYGVILVDAKSGPQNAFEGVLDRIPRSRWDDVIILDVNDTEFPVGFNVMEQTTSQTAVDAFSTMLSSMFKDSVSITAPRMVFNLSHALADAGYTFIDLGTMLTPLTPEERVWRDEVLRKVKNREVSQYVQNYINMTQKEADRLAQPVYNRVWEFTSRSEIKNILGQQHSTFKMSDVIEQNKILLVYLNGMHIGKQTASIAGTLIVNGVWQAAQEFHAPKFNFLYLDEFQDFVKLGVPMEEMLEKSRGAKLGNVLAHQGLEQLDNSLRSAVMTNTLSKVAFETSARDGAVMAREFRGNLREDDFKNLDRFEALAMVATDRSVSAPMTITTKAPIDPHGYANTIRNMSRAKYGRPVAEVEAELANRYKVEGKPRQRPKPMWDEWEKGSQG